MSENNKIIHLSDYIGQKKSIKSPYKDFMTNEISNSPTLLFRRSISFVVDLLVISLINTAIHTGYAIFLNEYMSTISAQARNSLLLMPMPISIAIFMSLYFSYFFFCTYILDGKTIGKMTMGLRVISEAYYSNTKEVKETLNLEESFKRSLGYLMCYLSFGTFFIFNFSSEDKRGLPDYISNSRTVSDTWLAQMKNYKEYQREQVTININSLDIAS